MEKKIHPCLAFWLMGVNVKIWNKEADHKAGKNFECGGICQESLLKILLPLACNIVADSNWE
jgi:hypothetical protein